MISELHLLHREVHSETHLTLIYVKNVLFKLLKVYVPFYVAFEDYKNSNRGALLA